MKPDDYLDSREFIPSEMEALVKNELQKREGCLPEGLTKKELSTKWELLICRKKTKNLKIYRAALAAACLILTVNLAAALLRPVGVQGNDTYITINGMDGTREQFVFRYKEVNSTYGRLHKYRSFKELEVALGFSLVKPKGQEKVSLYLESRPKSGLYNVSAYFEGENQPVISGYSAYFGKEEEESYGYSHEISQDWTRIGEKSLAGRDITLYELGRSEGSERRYGAAFSEDGVLYVLFSAADVSLELFQSALETLEK